MIYLSGNGKLTTSDAKIQQAFAQSSDDIREVGSYSIFALQNIILQSNVTMINGNVGVQNVSPNMQLPANTEINIGSNTKFQNSASAVAGDSILISNGDTIQNIYYNQLQNSGTILGTRNTPLQLPLVPILPSFPHSTSGSTAINVPASSSYTLQPGVYGSITIGDSSVLHMTGGIYNVTSITAGKDSKILFDNQSQVVVQNQISWKNGAQVGPSTSSIHPSDILIFVGGNTTINQNTADTSFGKNALINVNIYAPTGTITMDKGTIATGAFIAKSIVIKQDSIISRDSAFDRPRVLANEYMQLIEKLNEEGNTLNQTTITQGLIDQTNSDLARLKNIVIELQNLGFDGRANATRIGQHMVGTISFSNVHTSELLFGTQIPDGTLGIFSIMGLNNEYYAQGVQLSFDQLADLLQSSSNIVEALTNLNNDQIASNFVLASIAEFHPSTGHTFVIIAILLVQVISMCLENPACETAIHTAVHEATTITLNFLYPFVTISGLKFNDINANGMRDDPQVESGLSGWEFILPQSGDPAHPDSAISDSNGNFSFIDKRLPRTTHDVTIVETPKQGWNVTTSGGLIQQKSFNPPTTFPYDQVVPISVQFGNHMTTQIPRNGLVGEWNFENNVFDTSGTGNNGALIGGASFVTGTVGNALNFDGTTGVVTVPNNPTLNFGSVGSFSISLWMKSTQSGTGNTGFGWLVDHRRNNDGTYQGYTIGDGSGIIQARIRDDTANDVLVSSTTNVNDGNFHHVVFVVDRSSQTEKLYVDNSLQSSADISSVGNIDTNFDVHLGGTASPDTLINFFAGTMDQTRIYNRVLSTFEIQSLFDEGASTLPTGNLVGEWKFENNVLDTSGMGNNGVTSGGTSFVAGKIGQALNFDGISGVVTVPDNPTLNFGSTGSFSISLWMKSTQSGNAGFGLIVDKRPNNDGQYKGYSIEDNSGQLIGRIRDGTANDVPVISTTNVNDGNFHHIVYVVDRSSQTAKLYVDSNLQATASTLSVGSIDSSVNLLLGGQASPNTPVDFFNGIIDQTRIYSKALSDSEIRALFNENANQILTPSNNTQLDISSQFNTNSVSDCYNYGPTFYNNVQSSANTIIYQTYNAYCEGRILRADISSIPSNAIINSISFQYNVTSIVGTPPSCALVDIMDDPLNVSSATIWSDMYGGINGVTSSNRVNHISVSSDSQCTTVGNHHTDILNSQGITDITSQVRNGKHFFAVAMTYGTTTINPEVTYPIINGFQIQVSYSIPPSS